MSADTETPTVAATATAPNEAESPELLTLSNGVQMHPIGFGTAFGDWNGDVKRFAPEEGWAVFPQAFSAGYTHFDTALVYGTQPVLAHSIGEQLRSGVKRSELFLTSKVFHPELPFALNRVGRTVDHLHGGADMKSVVATQVDMCLKELCVGYVDLMLLHWPGNAEQTDAQEAKRQRRAAWEALEEAMDCHKVRAIGVSNFSQQHLEELAAFARVQPVVNQIEVHPYNARTQLVDYCQSHGVTVVAWAPFGSGAVGVLSDPVLNAVAEKHHKNVGQVILRWLLQRNCAALPKSSSQKRMTSNLQIFDFKLDEGDMDAIAQLDRQISSVPDIDVNAIL